MKRTLIVLLALVLALGLFACAKLTPKQPMQEPTQQPTQAPTQQPTQQPTQEPTRQPTQEPTPEPTQQPGPALPVITEAPEPAEEEWDYTVQVEHSEQEYTADDGTVVATEVIERPVLKLVSAGGEAFSGSAPEKGVTAEQLAVCKTFNDAMAENGLFGYDIGEEGRVFYEEQKDNDVQMPSLWNEVRVVETNRRGNLLSILMGDSVYLGGAHPGYGLTVWNYDLLSGAFVELTSLTDRPAELRETIVYELAAQIYASDYHEIFFDGWFDSLMERESFEIYFGAESMTVFFQQYDLGPYAIGLPSFEIPYGLVSRFLNDHGEQLLALPIEARVIGDFHEAQSLWSWLEAGATVDYSDYLIVDDIWYSRVDDPDVHTLADVRRMLSRYVDESFVEEELAKNGVLREFNGILYAASVGRGDDLSIASVDYEAQVSGEEGKVIVTIYRQDYDNDLGDWVLTGESDVHEFPFILRSGHAVFSTMESIY